MARRRFRKVNELQRVLGWPALYSTAYGNVGSSIYYALGVVAAFALGLSPVVFMIAGLVFALTSFSYAEATAAVPEAGGSSSFARRAFNELVSFADGWALMLDYIITIAISAFFVPNYLAVFFPVLKTWPANTIGGVVVILLLVLTNIVGVKEASGLNIFLAVLDLLTQMFLIVVGLLLLFSPEMLIENIHWGVAPTWGQLLFGISIAMIAYTGIETVSNLAGEAKEPGKDVPKSIIMVLITVLVMYASISVIALSIMPVKEVIIDTETDEVIAEVSADGNIFAVDPEGKAIDEEAGRFSEPEVFVTPDGEVIAAEKIWATDLSTKWLEDPVMGIVKDENRGLASRLPTLAKILAVWVGILAATILLIATNAGILGISRLTFSMGKYKQLPPRFAKLHSRFKTPYMAIIFAGGVAAFLILPGSVALLADLYSFGAMIGFTSAHLSVIVLRIKEPDLERPFKAPLNFRIKGVELPLTAIIGGIATFSVWIIVVVTHPLGRYVGFTWLAVGLVIYFFYRRSQKLPLMKTIELEEPATLQYPDVEYDNILVPIIGNTISREAMVMACELASEEGSSIYALHVIEIPMNRPVDDLLPEESELAGTLLAEAKEVAEEFGVKLFPKIVPGRNVGRVIVDEAIDKKSQIVMIGTERKRRAGDRFFGTTVEYILRKAPCKVLVVSSEKTS
jgi:APA family basic amino acid/polyamine antiporter